MKTPTPVQLESIARRYGLQLIVLFGSQVEGRARPDSDLDVGVLARRQFSASRRMALWSDLVRVFETEVDLTFLSHSGPVLMNRIARYGQCVYEARPHEWQTYRSYMIRRYWDSTKFIEATERQLTDRIREITHAR
jgi:predicted nucleotidyltransferase